MKLESMTARCTSCKKVYTVTEKQQEEAHYFGCLMSPCCAAPATVEQVTAVPSHPRTPMGYAEIGNGLYARVGRRNR